MPASRVRSVGSAVSSAAVMLVSVPSGTTSISAPSRVKPTSMLRSMLRISTAPVKTLPAQMATAAKRRRRARLAPPEILQGEVDQEEADARAGRRHSHPSFPRRIEVGHRILREAGGPGGCDGSRKAARRR